MDDSTKSGPPNLPGTAPGSGQPDTLGAMAGHDLANPLGPDRTPRDELADATAHGQVYLHRLQRAQLNLSLVALVAFGAIFGVLPLALYLLPHLAHIRVLTLPLTLWIIVVPMLPVFLAIGWLYARRADEIDEAFRDLVER